MELNQEYYKTVYKPQDGGLDYGCTDTLDNILPKMHSNGLTRLDQSNIWALNHGCHFIGSGGASKSIAGMKFGSRVSTVLYDSDYEFPFEGTTLTAGDALSTTGEFQTYSAIRWAYGDYYNPNLGYYCTLTSERENLSHIRFITDFCIKQLIAVPIFAKTDIKYDNTNFESTAVDYAVARDEFKAESHIKYTNETYSIYELSDIKFYYGKPGSRVNTNIFPLIESNYNNINYFASLTNMGYSGHVGVRYTAGGNIPQLSIINNRIKGEYVDYIEPFGKLYDDAYVNADGTPIIGYSGPLWFPAWYSRSLLSEYIVENNNVQSIAYDPEAESGIVFYYNSQIEQTRWFMFITPVGAVGLMNSLGITWAEDETSAINYDPDAASAGAYSVHIGVMEPGGITLGEGLAGDDIKKASNFGICEITDTPYDGRIPDNPGQNVDPDTGDIPLNTPGVTPFNTFNHMYCMTQSEVNDFASKIWNADETLWEQIVNGLSLYGEMPINAIISLRMYPIDLLKLFDVASTSIMRIGKTAITLDSQTEFVTKQKTAVVNMGSCVFPARYNNFLDYEPYTKAMLYLPYCGTVDVATADVVGKTVQVYYIIDVMTGGCTAVVYFGGIPYFYKNGRVGVEIPITANADSAVTSDALSLVTGGASSLLAAATGNPVAAALSLPSMVNSGLQLAKDSRSSFQTTGTQTPTAAQWTPQNAYFIVQRSVPDEPAGYGHSVGYVTLEGGTLGSFTGYTVMSNPDLTGVDCTEGEKEMIRNLLESGIYC